MAIRRVAGLALIVLTVSGTAEAAASSSSHDHPKPVVLAPGYADLEFEPPGAGSYALPALGAAPDGQIIDSSGKARRLHGLFGDKIAVLSFIYTTCSDVNGCPLATHVLRGLQERIMAADDLRSQVRLVSFSFDPAHDTPAVLRDYSRHFKQPGFDWQFVTCDSMATLAPVLEGYDQWVIRDYDEEGNFLGTMSHVLRVYLIDRDRLIRNIYSVSFLHADTVANDIRTLLLERQREATASAAGNGRRGP